MWFGAPGRQGWQRAFVNRLRGQVVSMTDMAHHHLWERANVQMNASFTVVPPEHIMSETNTTWKFLGVHPSKAHGADRRPPSLLKKFSGQFARVYHPMYLKSTARGTQPLHFKGGLLHELYKGGGKDPF